MWLFPALRAVKSPGKKLGDYITSVLPVELGGLKTMASVAITSLPHGPSAASIRPGVCNMLMSVMPGEIAVGTTGHEMKGSSAIWDYVDAAHSVCMAGGVVLAAWPAFPWGQLGRGPSAPSLIVLSTLTVPVTIESLNSTIDTLFNIYSTTAPQLQQGGRLRPMVNASFAAMLMYHEERLVGDGMGPEMRGSCMKLEASVRKQLRPPNARALILEWGRAIMGKFKLDNARLYGMGLDSGHAQMAQSMRLLGNVVGELKTIVVQQSRTISALQEQLCGLSGPAVSTAPLATPVKLPTSEATATASGMAASGAVGSGIEVGASSTVAVEDSEEDEVSKLLGFGSLLPLGVAAPEVEAFSSMNAAVLYFKYYERAGGVEWSGLIKQESDKLKTIVKWFNAAATEQELELLRDPKGDEGQKRCVL